ncbi:UNVERIFIED_CONTAM: hypothetical protein Slati_0149400 [Sesamum latifolium]|uniref:DUF4283 domain-containing protein n=1 Tax=Sesamum latifolium TaxID=2727402 RepID=A0AAW2YA07_9LAMI
MSYAKTVQQPSAAHFQHDPVREAKKIFPNEKMRPIGFDCSYKGEAGIIYSSEETALLAARLKFTLVDKFSHGLSNLNFLRIRIVKLGLKGNMTVGRLNFKHVLIHLTNEEDFSRLWLRGEWMFDGFHMRVFKWSPNFDPQIESSIIPVWIMLPELSVHLFEKHALFKLAAKIGKPLRMDEPTADMSRPDLARTSCNHLGHDISACIAKHHDGISHTNISPRPTGYTSTPNKEPRDLREIINNRRKGKAVANVNTPVTFSIEHNVENDAPIDSPTSANDKRSIANDVPSPPLHVPEPTLTARAMCRDWDAETKSQNAPHYMNIEAVEGLDRESDQDIFPSVVPNSLSEETSPKEAGTIRNFFWRKTSRQRCSGDQP